MGPSYQSYLPLASELETLVCPSQRKSRGPAFPIPPLTARGQRTPSRSSRRSQITRCPGQAQNRQDSRSWFASVLFCCSQCVRMWPCAPDFSTGELDTNLWAFQTVGLTAVCVCMSMFQLWQNKPNVTFTLITILRCTVAFSIFPLSYNHLHHPFPELSHPPEAKLHTH